MPRRRKRKGLLSKKKIRETKVDNHPGLRKQGRKAEGLRAQRLLSSFCATFRKKYNRRLEFDISDRKALSRMLKANPELRVRRLKQSIIVFFASRNPFLEELEHPLRYWASNVDRFLKKATPDMVVRIEGYTEMRRKKRRKNMPVSQRIRRILKDPTPDMVTGMQKDISRATHLFGRGAGHAYLDLAEWVGFQHRSVSRKMLRILGIGQLSLCREFLDWVESQHWISVRSLKMLDPGGKIFARFRTEWASNEALGRDPVTGEVVA